jgi:DNA-binding transcriptional MerR regulator
MSLHENLSINKLDFSEADQFFKTIGEVSAEIGIPPHVLRFWESKFFRIKPHKRKGGHRYYNKYDIEAIYLIKKLLYEEGYTIRGAQKLLREKGYMQQNHVAESQQSLFSEEKPPVQVQNQQTNAISPDLFGFPKRSVDKVDPRAVKILLKELESIRQTLNKK